MTKRIVVTGSKGFIGSHIMRTFKDRGYVVSSYDLKDGCDILNSEMLNSHISQWEPSWIVHLAAQPFLKPSIDNPQNDASINIVGTLNVLEAANMYRCGIIFSSSGAVYGNNYQYPEPISPYGLSKLTAEKYCMLYHHLYKLNAIVFRFSSVYGSRRKASINIILEKALKNEVIQLTGDGTQTRDFIHVSDVVEAIFMGINGKFPSGVYDIGTGTALSINDLIRIIEDQLKQKVKVKYVTAVKEDPKRNELNVSKAETCGFKAKVSIVDGIRQLIGELK